MPSPAHPSSAGARLARLYINGNTPDPEVADALRREIKETTLERHVRKCLETAPALTTEQRQRIASILTGGGQR